MRRGGKKTHARNDQPAAARRPTAGHSRIPGLWLPGLAGHALAPVFCFPSLPVALLMRPRPPRLVPRQSDARARRAAEQKEKEGEYGIAIKPSGDSTRVSSPPSSTMRKGFLWKAKPQTDSPCSSASIIVSLARFPRPGQTSNGSTPRYSIVGALPSLSLPALREGPRV